MAHKDTSKENVLSNVYRGISILLAIGGLIWGIAYEIHRIESNALRSKQNSVNITKVTDAIHSRNEKIDSKLERILRQVTINEVRYSKK